MEICSWLIFWELYKQILVFKVAVPLLESHKCPLKNKPHDSLLDKDEEE